MSRISLMTWGLLLILIGVQLNLVDSFVLTPRATKFGRANCPPVHLRMPAEISLQTDNGAKSCRDSPFRISTHPAPLRPLQFIGQLPYSTPNYRRIRSSGRGVFQAGYRNNPQSGFDNNGSFRNAGYAGAPNPNNFDTASNRFAGQKMLTPPSWFCWPPVFLGAVLFLFGAAGKD